MDKLDNDDVDFAIMTISVLQGKSRRSVAVARRCFGRRCLGNLTELERFLKRKSEACSERRNQRSDDILQLLTRFVRKNQGAWPEAEDWESMNISLESSSRSFCINLVLEAKDIAQELRGHFGKTRGEREAQREAQKAQQLQREKEWEIEKEELARRWRLEKEQRLQKEKHLKKIEDLRKLEEQKIEAERYSKIREKAQRYARPRREASLRWLKKIGKPPLSTDSGNFIDKDQV